MVIQCYACLGLAWLFFAAAASLALIGSGSLEGIGEFWIMGRKMQNLLRNVCWISIKQHQWRQNRHSLTVKTSWCLQLAVIMRNIISANELFFTVCCWELVQIFLPQCDDWLVRQAESPYCSRFYWIRHENQFLMRESKAFPNISADADAETDWPSHSEQGRSAELV